MTLADTVKRLRMPGRSPSAGSRFQLWFPGVLVAIACGAIYLANLPPLFDFDGYTSRMYALQPERFYNQNPHHLLWNSVQIVIASAATHLFHGSETPFQLIGILVNCVTLFMFYLLLSRVSGTWFWAAASTVLIAFSPQFWYLGFQNQPYPLLFLLIVVYLDAWQTADGGPPRRLRLVLAASSLILAILLQQAAIVLVPGATIVLLSGGSKRFGLRLIRGLVWSGSVVGLVAATYIGFARALGITDTQRFLFWVTDYAHSIHPFRFDFPASLIKGIIGFSSALVQTATIVPFLTDRLSAAAIFALYGSVGLGLCIALILVVWRAQLGPLLLRLARQDALFAVSILSIAFWSAFVLAWEPANPKFWFLDFFPGLVVLGRLVRNHFSAWSLWMGAALALCLSAWNAFADHDFDRAQAKNDPQPLIARIEHEIGPHDVFVVLGRDDGLGDMNYELLFEALAGVHSRAGLALGDFVKPTTGLLSAEKLREKIDSSLKACGRVFVAAHVFDRNSYPSGQLDPFSFWIEKPSSAARGLASFEEVGRAFRHYRLEKSEFEIGSERYFAVAGRRACVPR